MASGMYSVCDVYFFVCAYVHADAWACVCVCVVLGEGLRLMWSALLSHSPPYFVEQDLSLNLELIIRLEIDLSSLVPLFLFLAVSVPGFLSGCLGPELRSLYFTCTLPKEPSSQLKVSV